MSIELTRFKDLKVLVGIPSHFFWFQRFAVSYLNLVVYFNNYRVEQYRNQVLQTHCSVGSILPRQRLEILNGAIEMDADFLLWLDSDHTFPKNMLHRLIHQSLVHGLDVVAANCVTKSIPATPTARYKPRVETDIKTSEPVFTDKSSPELEQVWRVGTGVMLLTKRAIRALQPTCFEMIYRPEVKDYQGEDWSMAKMLDDAGMKIWVDHRLSDQVGHVGIYEYTHDVVGVKVTRPIEDENVVPTNAQAA